MTTDRSALLGQRLYTARTSSLKQLRVSTAANTGFTSEEIADHENGQGLLDSAQLLTYLNQGSYPGYADYYLGLIDTPNPQTQPGHGLTENQFRLLQIIDNALPAQQQTLTHNLSEILSKGSPGTSAPSTPPDIIYQPEDDINTIDEQNRSQAAIQASRLQWRLSAVRLNRSMLADRTGISPDKIRDYTLGYTEPSLDDIAQIASAVHTSAAFLTGQVDNPTPLPNRNFDSLSPDQQNLLLTFNSIPAELQNNALHTAQQAATELAWNGPVPPIPEETIPDTRPMHHVVSQPHTDIGDILKSRRAQLRLEQTRVAERADVSSTTVSSDERGLHHPTLNTAVGICQALNLRIGDLRPVPSPHSPTLRTHAPLTPADISLAMQTMFSPGVEAGYSFLTNYIDVIEFSAGTTFDKAPHTPDQLREYLTPGTHSTTLQPIRPPASSLTQRSVEQLSMDGNALTESEITHYLRSLRGGQERESTANNIGISATTLGNLETGALKVGEIQTDTLFALEHYYDKPNIITGMYIQHMALQEAIGTNYRRTDPQQATPGSTNNVDAQRLSDLLIATHRWSRNLDLSSEFMADFHTTCTANQSRPISFPTTPAQQYAAQHLTPAASILPPALSTDFTSPQQTPPSLTRRDVTALRMTDLRLQQHLSREQAATNIGISPNSLALYEGGYRDPRLENLIAIGHHYNTSLDYLLGLQNPTTDLQSHEQELLRISHAIPPSWQELIYEDTQTLLEVAAQSPSNVTYGPAERQHYLDTDEPTNREPATPPVFDPHVALQNRLTTRREEYELTSKELANAADIPSAALQLYENGKALPSADYLVRLSTALQTSTDWLIGDVDDPTPSPTRNRDQLGPTETKLINALNQFHPDLQPLALDNAVLMVRQIQQQINHPIHDPNQISRDLDF